MPKGYRKDGSKLGFQKGNKIRVGKLHTTKTKEQMKVSRLKWTHSEKGKKWFRDATHFGKYTRTEYHREIYRKNGRCMKQHTETAKKKISKASSGKNNPMYGKKHSEATKLKCRQKRLAQKFNKISSIEITIQKLLEKLKIEYIPQYSILIKDCATIVDMYIPKTKLCIYCDGDYWHNLPNYKIRDVKQNTILKQHGYIVLRLWEKEIHTDIEKCKKKILTKIN